MVLQHSVVLSLTPVDPSLPLSPHCLRPPLWRAPWWSVWQWAHERVLSPSLWLVSWCIRSYIDSYTPTDPPSPPLNTRVSSTQNQPSSSIITLEWDSPSSTGGVSVSYVLTISPTPLSGSPVTVETTSTQITVSYYTPYNVTIRADNCVGMSQESSIGDISIKRFLSRIYKTIFSSLMQLFAAHRLLLLVWPSPTHLLSLLVDPCSPSLAAEKMKWEPQPVAVVGGLLTLEPLTAAVRLQVYHFNLYMLPLVTSC